MTNEDTRGRLRRRTVLRGAGAAGIVGLAGCLGGGGGGSGDGESGNDTNGSGGGSDGDGGGGSGELEIVHWWTAGGEQDALNALLEGFEQEYSDVSVNNNPAPGGAGSALDTVIKNRVLNDDPPSTFQIWPGEALTPYTDADILRDIGEDVWGEEMRNNYLQGVKDLAQPEGNFVAVPINIHRLNNLFYNVEVVESAGVDPASVEETDAAPMAHQTKAPWSTVQLWETVFIGSEGADAFLDLVDGNVGDHEEAVRQSLSTLIDYEEHFNQDAGSISWDQANSKVVEGDAAFIHQGDWAAGQYKASEGFEYESGWNNVAFPGTDGVYSVVTDSFVFPKSNPSPDATAKFLQYCGTVDAQERFNPIKGSIPPRTDVPDDEFGPFLTQQREDFGNSESQPPTITHGTAVDPETKSNVEGAFANFIESWDVESAYSDLESALGN
ncbi:carbohydrate ABC transporter substrate-binding protein [Halobacteriales archaeon QS_5_70_17]|nr:MAG: carbohydrate ABC transporter substrate-binding protein [Halobacteriales archaeon QS_5_70_17]